MNAGPAAGWLIPRPFAAGRALQLAAAFFVAHVASLSLIRYGGPLAPAWPPVGIALAALQLLPVSHRRLVLVGVIVMDTLSNMLQGYATPAAASYLVVSIGELLLADTLLRRFASVPLRFDRVRDILKLLVATGITSAVVSVPAAVIAHLTSDAPLLSSALVWFVGDMLAFLIFTPFVLLLYHPAPSAVGMLRRPWALGEAALIASVVAGGSVWAFQGGTIAGPLSAHPYMLSIPILWATLRFGQRGALASVMLVGIVGVALLISDQPLSLGGGDAESALVILQVFLGVLAVSSLVLATALREQRDTAFANAQMVEALTASEQRLRQSQKMEAIGQLAGGVAHDFNNILAAILMQMEELRLVKDLPRAARELLVDAEASAQRAARLTRQLLVFSRQQAMQPRVLDLNPLVRAHVRLLRRVLPSTHTLAVTTAPTPLVVSADDGMIEQVLLNLVINARDAQADGGTITIATEAREVAMASSDLETGRYAVVIVTDTGTGISAEHLPRLFEPFFTTKPPGQGTGLGLATAYGIVQQHQGTIRVHSTPGAGTAMEVWLPVTDAPLPERATPAGDVLAVDTDEHLTPATILIVEDEPTVRRLLQRVLERDGYRVRVATTGREALDGWAEYGLDVDLVVTDVVMPGGISGTELARELQQLRPGLPIVYTSGYDPGYDPTDVTMVPGENFVPKPATAEQLLTVVRKMMPQRLV